MSLSAEVRMRAEYNVKQKRRLKSVVESQGELLKAREEEIESLKARLLLKEAKAMEAIRLPAEASNFETVEKFLRDETNALRERNVILEKEQNAMDVKVTELETSAMSKERELIDLNALVHEPETFFFRLQERITMYENCMDQLEKSQDDQMKVVNDKFHTMYADFVEMTLHLEEKFYPRHLTTISGRRWLLTHGMELAIANCLNSPEYLSALGAAIGKAFEKGMQYGLVAGITHGKEGRVLTDVSTYNPSTKVDYIFALQQLQNVKFSFLAKLKSNKDASVETVMDILHLEGPLAKKLGLNELQRHINQLMVHIHSSPDKVVVGATTLSLSFDVSSFRVQKIKENLENHRSTLRDVLYYWLSPFCFGFDGTIAPIFVDDYEVMSADDQAVANENAASFPNVDDAELNIRHFYSTGLAIPLMYFELIVSLGVDAAEDFKDICQGIKTAGERLNAANPQVVSAAKLPILNPNEFDLWKMRIEQYFLMTDYSLWERLARKNELKARGTLLMALPDKHQLKFNIHKDAKTLMEAIEKRFGENKETKKLEILGESLSQEDINLKFLRSLPTEWRTRTLIWRNKTNLKQRSLDDLFNNLKIYEAEVKSSSLASTSTQNIASVSSSNTNSTNEPISAAASVFAVSAKIPVSDLPNVDTLSNVVIYLFFASQSNSPQLDNDDLKQIDADDLEEMGLKWQMAMLTVECYNCYRKGHFTRECRYPKYTRRNGAAEPQRRNVPVETSTLNALVSQCDGVGSYDWSFYAEEEPTNYALMAFTSSSSSSSDNESNESLPPSSIYDRYQSGDGYHAVPQPYTGTFMPPIPDLVFHNAPNVDETVHTTFNVELSTTKPDKDLSPVHRPLAPIIDKNSYVSVKPVETSILAANPKTAIPKFKSKGNIRNRKACFVSILTKPKLVPINAARPVTAVVPKPHVTRPRQAKTVVTKPHSPPRRHIDRSPSSKASNFSPKVTAAKAPMVNAVKGIQEKWKWKPKCPILDHGNPQHALKDKGVIDSRCSRHMTGNMSCLSDFKAINGGYVAFGGNPKGGKISRKGIENQLSLKVKIIRSDNRTEFKNNDLNQFGEMKGIKREFIVPRTPQQNGIAERKNKTLIEATRTMLADSLLSIPFWTEAVNTAYSLGKFDGKVDEGFLVGYFVSSKAFRVFNSRTRIVQETLHINFLENKHNVAEKAREENVQQYVLFPVWSFGSNNPQNTDGDVVFEGKESEFKGRKPESEVHVSPSSSVQSKKHDDKTKSKAKGKSPIESSTGYRNLSAEFEDFSYNSINEVNVAGSLVPAVGQIFSNSTNTFSAAGSSNTAKTFYFDDEEDVGAETDFPNLETTITVSPIPTTKVHKDHPVTQIIGDLSSSTQTRSMTRVVKDQGGPSQINNDDFHTCMFACFLLQDEPKRIHQALKDLRHTQKEGIDYEEVFDPVARIEAVRLFLAYASFMGFMVYQMDVKSAFPYGTIEEEVYVCQPSGFEDPDYPDKIYVDDIIFDSINKDLCKSFEKLMKDKFQISSICKLTFFLGLQVKQKQDGIFISQDKYVAEILRKFGLTDRKSASTPIDTEKPLLKDPDSENVDVHTYRSMIGSLMYLTSSRPAIMFAVCACAHF
uniref:Putative ribonuclease H-like domain-containing protein n=1 Tax=Tanacetum cinerariifolium TaxID=118510 RepID=A0A6L2N0D3_TANCI|nr:putative ribonuclease H-like domain-containing protein [Tanacetum cinerariifolium]